MSEEQGQPIPWVAEDTTHDCSCFNCEHFIPGDDIEYANDQTSQATSGSGECRRYPPVLCDGNWEFPEVDVDCRCGEYSECDGLRQVFDRACIMRDCGVKEVASGERSF
jgi:hypothetical protein